MIVLDTHVLVWSVDDSRRLGPRAKAVIADEQADGLAIPAISIWEIALLDSRNRLTLQLPLAAWFARIVAVPGVTIAAIEPAIAVDAARLPGTFHKDPADRLIVATARHLGLPLVTADEEILAYATTGHVEAIDARH